MNNYQAMITYEIQTKYHGTRLRAFTHPLKLSVKSGHLWWLVNGGHFGTDSQWNVCMLCVAAIQVAHPLTSCLPPEVQETVCDGVVLKHDVVHMSVFL